MLFDVLHDPHPVILEPIAKLDQFVECPHVDQSRVLPVIAGLQGISEHVPLLLFIRLLEGCSHRHRVQP